MGYKLDGVWRWGPIHRLVKECVEGRMLTLDALHACSNKACFNPNHIYEGDDRQNALDRAKCRETPQIGETHTCAKLTKAMIAEAKSRYPEMSYSRLAMEYGVSKSTMLRAVQGKTWRH